MVFSYLYTRLVAWVFSRLLRSTVSSYNRHIPTEKNDHELDKIEENTSKRRAFSSFHSSSFNSCYKHFSLKTKEILKRPPLAGTSGTPCILKILPSFRHIYTILVQRFLQSTTYIECLIWSFSRNYLSRILWFRDCKVTYAFLYRVVFISSSSSSSMFYLSKRVVTRLVTDSSTCNMLVSQSHLRSL